jgi:1,2-diacylglycerol 3-alpha-glucosyltransferase
VRILVATQTYDPPLNGQGVFAIRLAEGLAAAGHDVMVLRPSECGRAYRREKNRTAIAGVRAWPLAPFAPQVYVTPRPKTGVDRALDAFRPDLVHFQDHYPLCWSAVRAACRRGLKLVGTNHFLPLNIRDEVSAFRRAPGLVDPWLWRWTLAPFRRADIVTAPSETAAELLRKQGLGRPVRAISNGVDTRRFRPEARGDRARMRRRYGLDPERALFLFVGRVEYEKRLDTVIDAMAILGRNDLQLAIAGTGRLRPTLESRTRRRLPPVAVVFTGFVSDEDLPALLRSADVFVMPSEAELQSIATLEAMASGLPVLASDAAALPELVKPGVNGLLFRSGEASDAAGAMARMMDARADWPRLGRAGREAAEGHDAALTVRRYETLYASLLSDARAFR